MSLSKDGIDNISLQFSRTPARYRAGEDLMGRIIVICNDTTPVKGIKLHIFGRMNIYWKKVEGGATSEFAEIEDYIDERCRLTPQVTILGLGPSILNNFFIRLTHKNHPE